MNSRLPTFLHLHFLWSSNGHKEILCRQFMTIINILLYQFLQSMVSFINYQYKKKCMGINQIDFQSKVNPVAYYVLFLKQKYKALMEDITANVEFERQN